MTMTPRRRGTHPAAILVAMVTLAALPHRVAGEGPAEEGAAGFWRELRTAAAAPAQGRVAGAAPAEGTVEDPAGDTFGTEAVQHDIVLVRAEFTATHLLVRVELDGPILPVPPDLEPGDPFDPEILIGFLEVDADQDAATGSEPPLLDAFCGPAGIGPDFGISIGGALGPMPGPYAVLDPEGDLLGSGPVSYEPSALSFEVPLSLLGGDDGPMHLRLAVGTLPEPTDCAPDGTFLAAAEVAAVPSLGAPGYALLVLALLGAAAMLLGRRRQLAAA